MSKTKILISIVIVSLIINIAGMSLFYYVFGKTDIIAKLGEDIGGVTKVINKKTVEEKLQEYVQIKDLQTDITKAIDKSMSSVVTIVISKDLKVYYEDPFNFFGGYVTQRSQKIGGGSGIIVSSDGYVITNKHVVEDASSEYTVITKDGDTYKVSKIWLDPVLDIAVLKITDQNNNTPTNLISAPVSSIASKVNVGQFVIAIGNSLAEFQDTTTFGIISGKGRKLDQVANNNAYIGLYQTDAAINPGNSGGPLLDINGDVIGINTAISSVGQGIGFAIPINKEFVRSTLDIIQQKQKIIRPFIGLLYIDLDKSIAKNQKLDKFEGILVQDVVKGSPAEAAGIQKGDIITEVNGKTINQDNNFLYYLYTAKPGDKVDLVVYSKKDFKKVSVTLGEIK